MNEEEEKKGFFGVEDLKSILGAFGGTGLNVLANGFLQDRQFDKQDELQNSAFHLNQLAVRNQAPLQVQGMQNAGLNPASATGTGAPSVPTGTASGASANLANIFDGIAEIVQASKMPADIERTKAETEHTRQLVNVVIPQQMEKLSSEVKLLTEEIRGSKNVNDAYEASDKFLRSTTSAMFDRMKSKMQSDGTYEALSEDTKKTLDSLASGEYQVGVGEIEALKKVIDAQANLSDADHKVVENAFDNAVKALQFNDKETMSALAKLPADNRKMLYKQMDKVSAEIKNIHQLILTGQADEALKKAQKLRTDFDRESAELNDVKWLAKQGRDYDVDVRTSEQALENVWHVMDGAIRMMEAYAEGTALGKGIGAGQKASDVSKPLITSPSEKQIIKVNGPNTFRQHMDFH